MWLDDLPRDLGYALRTLRKTPAFTVTAVLTLALGIGAVTVIYSLLRNVLLDPFPYRDSDRMVDIFVKDASDRTIRGPSFPASEFLDFQEQTSAFEDVVGTSMETMYWTTPTGTERLVVGWMTPNGFDFLGVPARYGRVFGPADAQPGAPPVAVLNHRTWMARFGGDPSVLGQLITLNGQPRTIVGIMPPRFEWNVADFWIPGVLNRNEDPQQAHFWAFQAHLRPGVTIGEAEAQLNVVAARLGAEHPQEYPPHSHMQVMTVIDNVVRQFRYVLYTLFAAVALLLVIACCNVANMLLARATVREREVAIRAALGATRWRIVRQLLAESATLAAGGALAGCVLAYGGIAALARLMPRQNVPWETQLRLDRPVFLFAIAAAVIATMVFGMFPALQAARRELMTAANSTGRSGGGGRRQRHMRSGLVIAEVALSIVMLLAAGLLMRSFVKLAAVDPGIDPARILVAFADFAPGTYEAPGARQRFYRDAADRVREVHGIAAASLSSGLPPFGGRRLSVEAAGHPVEEQPGALLQLCDDTYFHTLGIGLLSGRTIATTDLDGAHKVAVVNETFARRYFDANRALGATFRLPRLAAPPVAVPDPTFQIVGIVADVPNQGLRDAPMPQAYVPYTLFKNLSLMLIVRTAGNPTGFVGSVKQAMQAADRNVAIGPPQVFEDVLQRSFYAQPRFGVTVLGMFAVIGLALVALGIYGVLAYTVSQQAREIAIRMALGGDRGHVLRMVFRMGLRLLAAGLVVGLAASLATNRLLVSQLWNTSPYDAITMSTAVGIVILIGFCACWVPAHRALRVEPMTALRQE